MCFPFGGITCTMFNLVFETQPKENAVRSMFNCGSLFNSASSSGSFIPVENSVQDDSDLLLASESEDSIIQASDVEHDETGVVSGDSDGFLQASDDDTFLASDVEDTKPKRPNYNARRDESVFLNKTVCIYALQSLLGIGSSTIQRIRKGESAYTNSRRQAVPKHPVFGFALDHHSESKWVGVVMFLWKTYQSSAEVMPTDFKMPKNEEIKVPDKRDEEFELRRVNHFVQSLQSYSSDPDVHLIGPGTFAGGCRFLQASSRTELYWEYYACCKAKQEDPASYSTFLRVANCILKPGIRQGHLKFRGINQHGKCNTCFDLKLKIKESKNVEKRQEAYKDYSHHLLSQWLDRQQYWSYRTMSQTWFSLAIDMGDKMQVSVWHRFVFFPGVSNNSS